MSAPNSIPYSQRDSGNENYVEKQLLPLSQSFVYCGECAELQSIRLVAGNYISFSRDVIGDSEVIVISSTSFTGSFTSSVALLGTGSTYPFTSSWALNSLTASYALNGGGVSLGTGSTYPFTSSWSVNSVSSSHAVSSDSSDFALVSGNTLFTASYSVTASYALNGGGSGTTISTGSTYPITSSWSINSLTASFVNGYQLSLGTGSTYPITSSWALNSLTASFVSGYQLLLGTGSTYPITSSWALNARTASFVQGYQLQLGTGSTYPITSSWALNAISASYAPNLGGSSLGTGSTYPFTSSWSISSSWSPNAGISLGTGSTYPFTSSWAINTGTGVVISSRYMITGSALSYQTSEYTLTNNDNGTILSINSGSEVRLNISRSLDPLFNCMVYQSGSGQIRFSSENGVNIRNRSNSVLTAGQYAIATLLRVNSSDFVLAGDVSS